MQFCLELACGCSRGKIRDNNEDNIYFCSQVLPQDNNGLSEILYRKVMLDEPICVGVFDGMGGAADGQLASFIAANTFGRDFEIVKNSGMLSEQFFNNAVVHMNDAVYSEAEKKNNHMGTTAVVAGFCDDLVYVCNVGDSRAYRLRNNHLAQISMDHVEIIPPFLKKNNFKPRLSQCIGMPPEDIMIEPYLVTGSICSGDIFVLCSDGLTDMVKPEQIQDILNSGRDAGVCAEKMIDQALENGGRDNTTVIVVKVSMP